MALDDDIHARATEQARLLTYLRQREVLDQPGTADTAGVEQRRTELEGCIAESRRVIAEHGDRILDAYRADHPVPA